jgi:type IV pilus assembly protein PilM
MLSTRRSKGIVGLDIEAGSVAATEVRTNGSISAGPFAVAHLEPGIFREGEVVDAEALGDVLKRLFAEHKLSRTVRIGVANQRVAARVLRLPEIEERDELETAIRFQAQDYIPMPLEQAVLDWHVVGHEQGEAGERWVDVVAVAARRDMLGGVMEALARAGLRPEGIDLSAFGMIRAVSHAAQDPGEAVPATLYCSLGDLVNIAVARGSACLFTRVLGFGVEGIAQRLAERRQLTLDHARQWLVHVGLDRPVGEVPGDQPIVLAAREALEEGAARLADELRFSLEYYAGQEGAIAASGVVACGPGIVIPGLVERLGEILGLPIESAWPQALSHLDESIAARLTLSYGLALAE